MRALNQEEMRRIAEGDRLSERVLVVDMTNGRLFDDCMLDIDPASGCVFAYTEDGAYWDYEYEVRWWCYGDCGSMWAAI